MHGADKSPVLLVGASGRVGRMVMHHWPQVSDRLPMLAQFRRSTTRSDCLIWDPLTGPEALLDAVSATGGFSAMIMLAGVTPGPGKNLALNRTLAEACLDAASRAGIGRVLLASPRRCMVQEQARLWLKLHPVIPPMRMGPLSLQWKRPACHGVRAA